MELLPDLLSNQELSAHYLSGLEANFCSNPAFRPLPAWPASDDAQPLQKAAATPDATVIVASMDLPFAMGRFCTTEGIENLQVGSDFRERALANAYGVLIADGPLKGLSARAIFVVDKSGKVVYKEICPEITEEPNYEAALCALKETTGSSHKCGCGAR